MITDHVMDEQTLREWLEATVRPQVTDVFQTHQPNVFYVSFSERLCTDEVHRLQSLNLLLKDSPTHYRRYMVWFVPTPDDEV